MLNQIVDLRKKNNLSFRKARQEKPKLEFAKNKKTKLSNKLSDSFLEWKIKEFNQYPKSAVWYRWYCLIFLCLIIVSILLKNLLMTIFLILAAVLVYVYSIKQPRTIKIAITAEGVKVGKFLYDFDELKSFWIFYKPPEIKELSLRSKKFFMPYIKIPLNDQDPIILRKTLLKFLPEKRQKESIVDEWMRRLKF